MRTLWREYGLIIILILVAMVGYLVVRGNEEDILAGSLDGLRDRLVAMIDDVASRQAIAAHFDRFKERVLAREVSLEEVEHVAANVMNLSNSGSTITPQQAALMLDMASSEPRTLLPMPETPETEAVESTPPVAPVPPTPATPRVAPAPPAPPTPRDLDALGQRLRTMLAFNGEAQKVMDERPGRHEELARHIRYRFEQGLHVDLDDAMTGEMKQRIGREVQKLERRRMAVVWRQNMAEELHAERERARRELRSVATLKKRPSRDVRVVVSNLESLESLKHLEALGYRPMLPDSIHHAIRVNLEKALEAAHEDIEAAMEAHEEALDEHMEELEAYLEEIEESLEELDEELEEMEENDEDDEDDDEDDDE